MITAKIVADSVSSDGVLWKQVKGFEGLYIVSENGDVISLPRNTTRGGTLKQSDNGNGYKCVCLCKNGKTSRKFVHRLVAEAFLVAEEGKVCNHKNGVKYDNRVENLEFVTSSENNIHAIENGLRNGKPWLNKKGVLNKCSKDFLVTDPSGVSNKITGLSYFCSKNNLHISAMIKVAQNKQNNHKGWYCEYI